MVWCILISLLRASIPEHLLVHTRRHSLFFCFHLVPSVTALGLTFRGSTTELIALTQV